MSAVLHLWNGDDAAIAIPVIARQLEAGDAVTVAVMPPAAEPALPAGAAVHRVPADLSYSQLLDLIFAADHVIAW